MFWLIYDHSNRLSSRNNIDKVHSCCYKCAHELHVKQKFRNVSFVFTEYRNIQSVYFSFLIHYF